MTGRSNHRIWAVISFVLMAFLSPSSAKVIYVDGNAPGPTHNGSSWANAYKHLQDALSDASSGDEIRVADGIYRPDEDNIHPNGSGDRTATFQLKNGVAIYGGFQGLTSPPPPPPPPPPPMSLNTLRTTVKNSKQAIKPEIVAATNVSLDESDPNARDFELYESILSGDLDGNDVEVNDPAELLNEPTRVENSYHVVTGRDIDTTAVLDGFTITGGNADGSDYSWPDYNFGGGMYNADRFNMVSSSPTVANCTLTANSALLYGGGMYISGGLTESSPTLINCSFIRNYAGSSGGGICNGPLGTVGSSSPKLTKCKFIRNSANSGGAIYNGDGSMLLTNCEFTNNLAETSGGGMADWSSVLINCVFSGNTAESGGGMYVLGHSNPSLINCTFAGNLASNGSALAVDSYEHNYPSNVQITNCILRNDGNEIHNNDNSTIEITYSNIQGGWPGQGNIDADPCFVQPGYWEPIPLPGQASVPNPPDGATNVNIIADLSWTAGSGATSHDVYFGTASVPPFIGNQTSTTFDPGTMAYVTTYSWRIDELNIGGKTIGQLWSFTTMQSPPPPPIPPPPLTLLLPPPLLPEIQVSNAEQYVWVDGYYHLRADSPCINAGDPNYVAAPNEVDLDGRERVFGGRIDMGAYEYQVPAIYVDANAPGPTHDGLRWANAYKYLQDALADAGSAAKPVEILIAQGIYKPDQSSADPCGSGDRTATFQLINGVTLKGGYAGFGEPDPYARDIEFYETILSGDLAGNDLDVNDPSKLLGDPCRADNSYRVVTGSGTDVNAVLDGFTITSANNDRFGFPIDAGGGIFSFEGSPTITNCILRTNAAFSGGGMSAIVSQGYIYNCIFIGNYGASGGGIFTGASNSTISNCKFIGNQATKGGGVRNVNDDPILMNCLFVGNSAYSGGGIASRDSNPMLTNCTFSGNSASCGGGMHNDRGISTLTNCTFKENLSGGGICTSDGTSILTNCILWGDTPLEIYGDAPTVTYSNVQGGWPGLGNNDADPCFADANNGDYHLKSQAGRWEPNSQSWVLDNVTSPCIDSGNPGCPLRDEPNDPNNVRINMGAYGGTAEASKSPAYWRSIADMTNDWVVNSNDLKVFVGYWLQKGECIPSDLDRSGSVDFYDFAIFGRQ